MATRESVTDELARFVSATPSSQVPAAAREAARRAILDTIGVALAGSREPVARIVVEELLGSAPSPVGTATVIGRAVRASPTDAALANGVAAHALDYDDTNHDLRGHPSTTVLPAALAAVELAGGGGADLAEAYLVGIEVVGRVGRALGLSHARAGFHSTSTAGVLGAAAAGARALGLDLARTAAAFGIAASSAAGLRSNFGTMTKSLHAGHAARDGVAAALLARRGVTAHPDALPGLVAALCPDGDDDAAAMRNPGHPWEAVTPGIAVKKYPCCNRGSRAADAILDLVRAHSLRPADVREIRVRMPAGQVDELGRVGPMTFPRPRSGLESKFSMPYVMAAAVVDRGLRLAAFTDEGVQRPDARELLDRVRPENRTDDVDAVEVVVHTVGGQRLAREVIFTRGDPRGGEPLPWDELVTKFADCASAVLDPTTTARVAELVGALDGVPDISVLTTVLVGAVPSRA
jgi:2-methylcitrate dehydratase PrpD